MGQPRAHRISVFQDHRPTGVRDERPLSWSRPGLCTSVDIRSTKAPKVSISLTFRPVLRDPDVSGLDRQVVLLQADRTSHSVFLSEQNTMLDA
jgi:hypothetical protein